MPHRHTQDHDTRHGNMIQTEFTGEDNEFEYKGYDIFIKIITVKYNDLIFLIQLLDIN